MEPQHNQGVKFMCSYGGKIQPRHHDKQLTYVGGDTMILTVHRNIKFIDMVSKVDTLWNFNTQYRLKYQVPGQDIDALASIINDDDVENMMVEYDCVRRISTLARLRLFVFPVNRCAIPCAIRDQNPDFLFGLEEVCDPKSAQNFELPQFPGGGDPGKEASFSEGTEIQGPTEAQLHGSNVTSGISDAYTATPPPVYWIQPVTVSAYQEGVGQYGGMGNREQLAYYLLGVSPSAQEQRMVPGVAGAAWSLTPPVAFVPTASHESQA